MKQTRAPVIRITIEDNIYFVTEDGATVINRIINSSVGSNITSNTISMDHNGLIKTYSGIPYHPYNYIKRLLQDNLLI